MADRDREPTHEDSPLFRSAYERADDLDNATTPAERKSAWRRLLPSALGALVEAWLREAIAFGALLACAVAVLAGVTSDDTRWLAGLLVAAVLGAVLVLIAMLRRWSFGKQWLTFLGVLALEVGLLIAQWMLG